MTNTVALIATNKLFLTATNKLLITSAYKYVAMTAMIAQANLFAAKVGLPLDHPIAQKETVSSQCNVSPPRLMEFTGGVGTEQYFFGFGNGRLANFWQVKFHTGPGQDTRQRNEQWSAMTSQIGTNEVHQLALNWLTGLGMDVSAMEQKYPCKITQKFFYPHPGSSPGSLEQSERVSLPVFQIQWGSIPLQGRPQYSLPAVTMTIFGPTKELMEFHMLGDSFYSSPKIQIRDTEKLLAIPDEKFKDFSDIERSNLVEQALSPPP